MHDDEPRPAVLPPTSVEPSQPVGSSTNVELEDEPRQASPPVPQDVAPVELRPEGVALSAPQDPIRQASADPDRARSSGPPSPIVVDELPPWMRPVYTHLKNTFTGEDEEKVLFHWVVMEKLLEPTAVRVFLEILYLFS